MSINELQAEKDFTRTLIAVLAGKNEVLSREEVRDLARKLAPIQGYEGDINLSVEEALVAVDTRMGAGNSLVDIEARHDEEWVFKRNDVDWVYSDAYGKFLESERWHPNVVQSLSDVGKRILGHLQDPNSEGSWNRRGLVIGHVQSGKTANYMGVIARAADAGYKFIIVIAGIHNNLRKQTQERIDEGFVGRSSDPEDRGLSGVGQIIQNYPCPATLTNIYSDFNKATANQSGWRINDFSKPIVLVIKKNVYTLDALHHWLKELNAQGDGRISDVPILMIDDEADHASINTNKPELDPTKTNTKIRRILGLFAKSCYVGYTATPFANIFINPDAYDDEAYDELFPRDFIYCLDAPNTYFGPDKVFLVEENSENILKSIVDAEDYLPFSHKKDDEIVELPPSLYQAVNQFILVKTIRNLRGQRDKHCSMMINVSRFVAIQNTVRDFIASYEKKLRDAVKANYKMPETTSGQNRYMITLKQAFESDFSNCEFDWGTVKEALYGAFGHLRVYVINSKSQETLNYREYEKDGHGLTAIAIGGLSLSRGLTIEGLCVSYMYRNTRMYDTLMQMGRWFGYRPGFEDLCRVHLSTDSVNWYSHIAEASEELRQQIKRMRRDKLSPRQFGLYVKAHPDRLLITAANKMRSGEKITVDQNYSGRLIESYVLPTFKNLNDGNLVLVEKYWKNGFGLGGSSVKKTDKGWIISDVPVEIVEEFLTKFRTHPSFAEKKSAAVAYLRTLADSHPTADILLISLDKSGEELAPFRLGGQLRASARRIEDAWRTSKDRVASRGDEKLGLTEGQIGQARDIADEYGPGKKPSDLHYRCVRNKPLLMIHSLDLRDKKICQNQTPAFGISFPPGHYSKEIKVVANRVWIDRMHGPVVDAPDEEEDYDE